MSKRHVFEDILNSDFRWPMEGDTPFVEAADPMDNALIAKDDFARLVLMTDGYKRAADIAVAHCAEHPVDRDFLVYPIIFNYRQFIELSLKYQLATHGRPVEIEANWNTHKLEDLWQGFEKMLERYGTPDPDEADPVVASVVAQFAEDRSEVRLLPLSGRSKRRSPAHGVRRHSSPQPSRCNAGCCRLL